MVPTQNAPPLPAAVQAGVRRALIKIVVLFVVLGTMLFWCAGTVKWIWGWAYLALVGSLQFSTAYLLARRDPELMAERSQMQAGTKGWDKWIATSVALIAPIMMLIVAALDHRFHWTAPMPDWVHVLALVLSFAGGMVVQRAMLANHFFAATVRIQSERGHKVCDRGPYAVVRHPGYAAMIVFNLAFPFLLGSLWGVPIAVFTVALLVLRTALEDRTLAAELPGYAEYRTRVRYRLIPGVW